MLNMPVQNASVRQNGQVLIYKNIYLLNSITLAGLARYLVSKLTIKIFLNINKLDLMHFRNILDQMTLCGFGFFEIKYTLLLI